MRWGPYLGPYFAGYTYFTEEDELKWLEEEEKILEEELEYIRKRIRELKKSE